MTSQTVHRTVAIVAAGMLTAWTIGGCGGGPPDLPTPPPTPRSPATAPTPTVDPEHAPVLETYKNFIRAGAAATNRGDGDLSELAQYADGPALASIRAAIGRNAANDRVYEGSPTIVSAEVTHLELDAPPEDPNAIVTACVDISDYVLVDAEDRSPVPVERGLERYVATADFWHTDDGRWVVITTEERQDTPC